MMRRRKSLVAVALAPKSTSSFPKVHQKETSEWFPACNHRLKAIRDDYIALKKNALVSIGVLVCFFSFRKTP